jgi:hypothetical protein
VSLWIVTDQQRRRNLRAYRFEDVTAFAAEVVQMKGVGFRVQILLQPLFDSEYYV